MDTCMSYKLKPRRVSGTRTRLLIQQPSASLRTFSNDSVQLKESLSSPLEKGHLKVERQPRFSERKRGVAQRGKFSFKLFYNLERLSSWSISEKIRYITCVAIYLHLFLDFYISLQFQRNFNFFLQSLRNIYILNLRRLKSEQCLLTYNLKITRMSHNGGTQWHASILTYYINGKNYNY